MALIYHFGTCEYPPTFHFGTYEYAAQHKTAQNQNVYIF